VAPPARRASQPHQACSLGGDAVGGHKLLLLAHGADEAERMGAEADQAKHREQSQAQHSRGRHAQALAGGGGSQYQERQRQPGGDLDPDPRDQRDRAGAKARAGPGGEEQRARQSQQQQRVVVIAADRQLEQHRIQAHEGGGEAGGVALLRGCAAHQRDRGEAGGDRERLQGPQPTRKSERGDRVATEGEQWAIGGVLEGPAYEQIDGVGGRLGGDVGVRIQPVQSAQSRKVEVAEHILGDQRWAQQQH
jgi:hypothetical protein